MESMFGAALLGAWQSLVGSAPGGTAMGFYLDPEIDVFGFYAPFAMVVVVGGFLLAWLLAWAMDRIGLTRFVWHPPLFLFAMMIGCAAGLGLLLFPQ